MSTMDSGDLGEDFFLFYLFYFFFARYDLYPAHWAHLELSPLHIVLYVLFWDLHESVLPIAGVLPNIFLCVIDLGLEFRQT